MPGQVRSTGVIEAWGLAIVQGSYPKPGKVSEPLRALTSILPGLRSGEKGRRSGFLTTYIHYPERAAPVGD